MFSEDREKSWLEKNEICAALNISPECRANRFVVWLMQLKMQAKNKMRKKKSKEKKEKTLPSAFSYASVHM